LARYAKGCTGNGNINSEGGAGANLAIRAVANRGLLGVRFAFDPDVAAVARAVDFHEFVPFAGQPPPSLSSEPRYRCLTLLRPSRRLRPSAATHLRTGSLPRFTRSHSMPVRKAQPHAGQRARAIARHI